MKVRYTSFYTDEYDTRFEPGWVAEHADAEGARRIALGVCVEADKNARAFKYKEDAPLSIEQCVAEPPQNPADAPFVGKTISMPKGKTNNKH